MLPTDTARTMASGHETGESLGPALTQEERGWIEMLAAGTTVHAVARAVGRSERTMFRLLHELSHRMGVSNRMEAVRASSRSPSERPPAVVAGQTARHGDPTPLAMVGLVGDISRVADRGRCFA